MSVGGVVHPFNFSTGGGVQRQLSLGIQASLIYKATSRTARVVGFTEKLCLEETIKQTRNLNCLLLGGKCEYKNVG